MRKKSVWFSCGLVILCALLCTFFYPMVTSLTVYSQSQKKSLLDSLEMPLEVLAIEQARIVDPNYSWIVYPDQLSSDVENVIRETALSNQNSYSGTLSNDTNLAWIVTYNGKDYKHNWSDTYDDSEGTLDITFTAGNQDVSFSDNLGEGLRAGFSLFNIENRVVVNPTLVEEQSASNEFVYYLVLPEGFSIRYYIPAKLKANGGVIAEEAAGMDTRSIGFCLVCGACVILLYVLFWKKEVEADSFLFRRFIHLKAISAWLLLMIGCTGCTLALFSLTTQTASGQMRDTLYAVGMRFSQMSWFIPVLCWVGWFITFLLYALLFLYLKYIFAYGLIRYLKEDTLVSQLVRGSETHLAQTIQTPLDTWTWHMLLPAALLGSLFIFFSVGLAWFLFSWIGGLIVLALDMLLMVFMGRRMYVLVQKDYAITLAAANELARGNFSQIQPRSVGSFQSLYNSLIAVKDGFQTALKDGLASQNMKTQLISNVSHDLKTPVTGIKSYAELISMAQSLDQVQEYSKRLIGYTDRLNALITDLFDVARATSGDIQLNRMVINLSELVKQVTAEWQENLDKLDMTLVMDLPETSMSNLDADKTMRIIDNLIGNITKYAMPGTRVFITLTEIPGQYVLVFKNISKTPLDFKPDEITERFVRGDKSRHEPGSGLGLAIVKSFMEVQGGTFTIEIDGDVFKAILVFPKAEPENPPKIPDPVLETETVSGDETIQETKAESETEQKL